MSEEQPKPTQPAESASPPAADSPPVVAPPASAAPPPPTSTGSAPTSGPIPSGSPASANSPTSTASAAETPLYSQAQQRANRAENQDFMRVLGQYVLQNLPPVYVEHITVEQDMVLNNAAGGGPTPSGRVSPINRDSAEISLAETRLIQRVYQRHAAYPTALRVLREKRCVVLRGKPQVGKRAAAVRLALDLRDEQSRPTAPIWELPQEEDLSGEITSITLRPGAIYLVDGLLREQGRMLTSPKARNMLDTLEKHGCYLIICALPTVPFPADLPSVMLEPLSLPTEALVEVHLAYYGQFDSEQVRAALRHPQIKGLLDQGLAPAQANQLAQHLADALQKERPPEEALAGFAASAEAEVQAWFDETIGKAEASAFRIALAVFHSARYISVVEAARDLERRLQPPAPASAKTDAPPPASLLQKRASPNLASARAKRAQRQVATEYSDHATIDVVELENPGYSTALLKYLWLEFDDLRPVLLNWLCDYALRGPYDMRLRAAGALGALAGLDFDFLRLEVFRRWALTSPDDPDVRRMNYQALGNALGVLIWNDERASDVLGLLRDWVDDPNTSLRWAAARAYAQVGLRYPREAIHQWRRILESEGKLMIRVSETFGLIIPHPLHTSVVQAIVTLFLRAVELPHRLRPVYEQALEGLAAWVETDTKERHAEQVGLPLFLALTPIQLPPEDGSGDPEVWPPAMLYIIGTQPDSSYRRALAAMLRRALNHPVLGDTAIAALRLWTEAADRDAWLEQTLTALLNDLLALPAASERERNRLRMHFTRWMTHPKKPLNVAGRLLVALHLTV